jgi:hypothetical protein
MRHHLLTACFLFSIVSSAEAVCPPGGITTIVYGNGVDNTFPVALSSQYLLQDKLLTNLVNYPAIDDPSCIGFALAYDPAPFDDNTIANIAVQIGVISSVQLALQFAPQFPTWLAAPDLAPGWFGAVLDTLVTSSLTIQANVLDNHVALYNTLKPGKIIAVTHSQGNFYVNQAYPVLGSPDDSKFSVIGVATPADHVAGGGKYVTLVNDIITAVPFSLPPNITNPTIPGGPCTSSNIFSSTRYTCHNFAKSYMTGPNSSSAILNYVVNEIPVPLVVNKTGAGTGMVQSTPQGIDCGAVCTAAFPLLTSSSLTQITLTATPDQGTTFTGWSGNCTLVGTASGDTITFPILNVTADSCTAEFGGGSSLTLTKSGTGTGMVISAPAGINCGTACLIQSAPFNGSVQLTAVADPGSSFVGWGGNCSGTSPTTTIGVTTTDQNCVATFSPGGMLTISKVGTGTGTVVSMPPGINCGSVCAAPFTGSVQLTATPLPGSTFAGWGTDCSGNTPTTTINVSGNKSCTATFNSPTAVVLNPFGTQNLSAGPFQVQAVNGLLAPIAAPADITVTLERDVISPCEGLLFSSNRTVTISQGQTLGGSLDAAGRDPLCNGSPITTRWTVLQAVETPNVKLDLSIVPIAELTVSIIR